MFIGETGEQDETGEQGETCERGETGTFDESGRSDASASTCELASSMDHQLYRVCRCILSGKLFPNSCIKG